MDQQVGGRVVADANHLGGHFKHAELAAEWLAAHPAGAASHHGLVELEGFIEAELGLIQGLKGHQQDRRFDRAGRRQRPVGVELGEGAVIEHQHKGAHLQIFLGGCNLCQPAAEGLVLPLGVERPQRC